MLARLKYTLNLVHFVVNEIQTIIYYKFMISCDIDVKIERLFPDVDSV